VQPERPVQTTLAFNASRIVIDVGVLMAMAAMSMTFVSSASGNKSALAADALPAVLLLLPIFIVTVIPDHTQPLHPALGWASMVLALAALPYAFVKMLDAGVLADTLQGTVGFGPTLLLIGCAVTLVGIGIGIVRDLMGRPSGGTPQRHASYPSRRRAAKAEASEAAEAATQTTRSDAPVEATATAVIAPQLTGELTTPADSETETRIIEPVAEPAREQTEDDPVPVTSQPEIVFPDTGAVAREAEPEPVADVDETLLNTAERADAALTDHLLSMFDEDDGDIDEPAGD